VCSLKNLSTLKRPRGSTLPGLIISLTYRDINDGNVDKELIKEEYESIIALLGPLSFINHLQNNYGPIDDGFNITTVPHYQFDCFVACSLILANLLRMMRIKQLHIAGTPCESGERSTDRYHGY
jgi:hypothetical protein